MSHFNSQTPYIYVASSVSKFGGILSTPIWLIAVACYAAGPLKFRLSFGSQNVAPSPPKPLHKHRYIRRHFLTLHFSQLTSHGSDTACYDYCSLCSSLWVEISTLTYETKTLSWWESLAVAYCTHIIQTKVMLKNQRYPQISMFTDTEGPTDTPLVLR